MNLNLQTKCTKTQRKLCNNDNCSICDKRSFKNHPKAKYWNYDLNYNTPRDVCAHSNFKYWFTCPNCNHKFNSRLSNISNGKWCGYCNNDKLCTKKNCKFCYEKSFASHPKSKYWSNINKLPPRFYRKYSDKSKYFDCSKCNHSYKACIKEIGRYNVTCPYCNNKKLCTDNECTTCFEKSFASVNKSYMWSSLIDPRSILKCSSDIYNIICDKCLKDDNYEIWKVTTLDNWCTHCNTDK